MPHYRGWDLAIASEIALPGAMAVAGDGAVDLAPVDLSITRGSAALADPGRSDGPYQLDRDGFAFTMPGVARYRCSANRIVVDEVAKARLDDVAAMLIATVIPAVLWMRGDIVLHAAAAIPPGADRATAVLGRSGSGKSALLAQAAAAGWRLVADDSVRVRGAGDEVRISGLPGGYFAPLTGDDRDRPFVPVPPEQQCAGAEPGVLTILDDGHPAGRLTGADAVAALLTHRHRPRIARLLGIEHRSLATLAKLCGVAPIHARPLSARSDIAALPTGF